MELSLGLTESSLPYFIDVVNYTDIKEEKLKEQIDEFGIVIYRKTEA